MRAGEQTSQFHYWKVDLILLSGGINIIELVKGMNLSVD
jgi:hypothetical protein